MAPTTLAVPRTRRTFPIAMAMGGCILLSLLLTAGIRYSYKRAHEAELHVRMMVVATAIQGYRDWHGTFPPASVLDSDARPQHSWRVLILPNVESNTFWDHYDFHEAWNGPNNQRLLKKIATSEEDLENLDVTQFRQLYQSPSAPASQGEYCANFVMVVDPSQPASLMSPREASRRMRGEQQWMALRPAANDVFVVVLGESNIHWMQPRDLSLHEVQVQCNIEGEPISSNPRLTGGFVVPKHGDVDILDEVQTLTRLLQMQKGSDDGNAHEAE